MDMPTKYKMATNIKIRVWYQNRLEPYFKYYAQVFKYAGRQTAQTYIKRDWRGKVGFIVFNLIVIAIIFLWRSEAEGMEEMNVFISILIAFGIVALATLLWNFVIAPARLHFIQKHKIRTTQMQEYEAVRKEHCGVDLSMYGSFPFEEEHKTKSEHKITYRVGVKTVGLDSIHNVGVILSGITNLDRLGNRAEIDIVPMNLRVMGSSEKTIRVDPSVQPRQFFDVMEWYPDKSQIRICYHHTAYNLSKSVQDIFIIRSKHIELTIATQGQNVAETISTFHLLLKNGEWAWFSEENYELLKEAA